ncbi:hypothetical protein GCM10009863_44710 [Streptomyces axinellae]|uniref:Teneurin-like YD-shell domain-containing protein n=1 Tax=Streptomyces axinellae TaxID=552788 RepID=A0ABN3QFG3_9ACTN
MTPLGEQITHERDLLGRTVRKNAAGAVTTYVYDAAGRLLEAVGPDAEVRYQRDKLGRVKTELVNGRALTHTYDALGRRTRRTTPTGALSTSTYDPAGNRTTLTTSGHTLDSTHDAAGRETQRHMGDQGLTLTQIWDPAGRLTTQSLSAGTVVQERGYSYRADGCLTEVDDSLSGRAIFDLDAVGRVTAVHAAAWTERYAYDDAGNQTHANWPTTHPAPEATGPRTYSGTVIQAAGKVRYEHDEAGRIRLRQKPRLSKKPDTWHYTWDAEDRLTQVVTPDGAKWRYTYDPLGRRTAKYRMIGEEAVERTTVTWDGATLVEQTTAAQHLPHPVTLTWDHKGHTPLVRMERLTDEFTQAEIGSRFYAMVTDVVGTPTELAAESGHIAWRTRSTVWGTTTWHTNSTASTPLRFPGQYYDPETGLHYNYFRHYDPETARFALPDPLGLAPAPNPVAYVDNPHSWIDPLGLAPEYPDRPGFVERMKDKFRPLGYRADQIMRGQREPMRLGDLGDIETPYLGDPLKMGLTRSMDDDAAPRHQRSGRDRARSDDQRGRSHSRKSQNRGSIVQDERSCPPRHYSGNHCAYSGQGRKLMKIPFGWLRHRARVVSPFGWPVPAEVRVVDERTLQKLIVDAQERGFSRNGKRIEFEAAATGDEKYILTPILQENTPGESWICTIFAYDLGRVGGKTSPLRRVPHRLDVATRTFDDLGKLSPQTQDQLLHALIGEFMTSTPPAGAKG